jgi:hypothetical protein
MACGYINPGLFACTYMYMRVYYERIIISNKTWNN